MFIMKLVTNLECFNGLGNQSATFLLRMHSGLIVNVNFLDFTCC
jgi:hypothetical protein